MVNIKSKASSQHGAANKSSAVSSHTAKPKTISAKNLPITVKKTATVKRLQQAIKSPARDTRPTKSKIQVNKNISYINKKK